MPLLPEQPGCAPCDGAAPGCVAQGGVPYQGLPGTPGTAGTNGINAFSVLTSSFVTPAIGSNVTIAVSNSLWIVPGQVIFLQFAGYYLVVSVPSTASATIQNLGYTPNAISGTTIGAGAALTPSGPSGTPGSTTGVTSIGISVPVALSVSPSTITTSGTFALSWATGQAASNFLATPAGASGAVGLRPIVVADLPTAVTQQGNIFNGVGNLVQLDGAGNLPALSGASLTSLNASNISSGTIAAARLPGTVLLSTSYTNALRQIPTIQPSTPVTGATVTFGTQTTDIDLYLNPAGTLATLTINFPTDGNSFIEQVLSVLTTQIITALTVAVSGGTIFGTAATALTSGQVIAYKKIAANTWFRLV